MKIARLLFSLFVAVALAMPPLAVEAATRTTADIASADIECPHHAPPGNEHEHRHQDQHGDAKSIVHSCCPSAPFGWAVTAETAVEFQLTGVDRALRASPALHGLTFAKDPPPPRV